MPRAENTSSNVRQQRIEAHDSLDDFPTPPWATRVLCRRIAEQSNVRLGTLEARDPCAGRGHMVRPLQEFFRNVYANDVHDYGAGIEVSDFLFPGPRKMVDWTFLNPPFRLAEDFITTALETSRQGVVCIVRASFLEGIDRYDGIGRPKGFFKLHRPSEIWQFTERVVMLKGRLVQAGKPDPFNLDDDGEPRKASSATTYCAMVFHKDRDNRRTLYDWIGKCRTEFEVHGDYPSPIDGLARLYDRTIHEGISLNV